MPQNYQVNYAGAELELQKKFIKQGYRIKNSNFNAKQLQKSTLLVEDIKNQELKILVRFSKIQNNPWWQPPTANQKLAFDKILFIHEVNNGYQFFFTDISNIPVIKILHLGDIVKYPF